MKQYAVVIGEVGRHQKYVAYHPDFPRWDTSKGDVPPLAVSEGYRDACVLRRKVLASCGHKSVHIVRFDSVTRARHE